jgi:hypothetical protein
VQYVSFVETADQVRSALVVIDPPDAAENVACCRDVFAAGLVVPDAPGSARWSLTQNAVGCVQAVLRPRPFSHELRIADESPTVIPSPLCSAVGREPS